MQQRPNGHPARRVIGATALAVGALALTAGTAQATTSVVHSYDAQGWVTEIQQSTGSEAFVTGPGTPPLGAGSLQLATGPGTPTGPPPTGGKLRIANNNLLDGFSFDGISTFDYSSLVQQRMGGAAGAVDVVARMYVDTDGDGVQDNELVSEPVYGSGPNVGLNTWAPRQVMQGKFWFAFAFPGQTSAPGDTSQLHGGHGGETFYTAAQVRALLPHLTLRATPAGNGPIAFDVGQNSAGAPWSDFTGNLDAVHIVTTGGTDRTYDFEPDAPYTVTTTVAGSQHPVLAEATAGTVSVTASLDRPNTSGHTIDVTVADNGPGQTATAGADYTFTSPTVLHIGPGQQSASTMLTVKDDSLVEDDGGTPRGETVSITTITTDPSVASVADPTVPVRIADDDVAAIGTAITVRPVILQFTPFFQINLRLSANLHTTSGVPIAGQKLTFSAWFGTICTATTNSAGDANCSTITNLLGGILGLGYRVSYAGSPPFTASSADGGLL